MKLLLCTSGFIWFHFSFHVVIHWPDLFDFKVEVNSAFSLADSLKENSIPFTTAFPVDRDKWGQTFVSHDSANSVSNLCYQHFFPGSLPPFKKSFMNRIYTWKAFGFYGTLFLLMIHMSLSIIPCEEQTCYKVRCQASRSDCQGILHSSLQDIQRSSTEDSSHTSTKINRQKSIRNMELGMWTWIWTRISIRSSLSIR